jgi:LacI family transcriptional regulator
MYNANEPAAPAQARSTIQDVAQEAGVSTATVSRVLNHSGPVSPETRAAVLRAIERHGFAAQRRGNRARPVRDLVTVRCPYLLEDYFGIVLSAVERGLRHRGKGLVLSAGEESGTEPNLAGLLRADVTEGAVLILPPEPSDVLADLRAQGFPFVVIDPRTLLPANIAAVSAAHLAGSQMATEHLIGLEHRRIGAIAGPVNWIATDRRLLGYRAALAAEGRLASEELVRVGGEPTIAHGLIAARQLLALPEPPTAIVAFNDKIAIGAIEAATEMGLSVPADLSVVGFDDLDLSRVVTPRLTTVRQPLEEMARMGVELLIRLIEGREIHTLHIELATELVLRGSTAPPRG